MFLPSSLHTLLSGERRDWSAKLFRLCAGVLEYPVRWWMNRRNTRFDTGANAIYEVYAKVISVGNITVGGTGKTPFVAWLAQWLATQNQSSVLISRGYGSRQNHANDEALELAAQLPNVPHLQNSNRIIAALQAAKQFPNSVLLLDDALQHRQLHRDLDIVLLDAFAPFGYEHLLPRGLLREPVTSLKRAHIIILTRANHLQPEQRELVRQRVVDIAPEAIWAEAIHAPVGFIDAKGEKSPLHSLSEQHVLAFCGIGNPRAFRETLQSLQIHIAHWQEFADHHAYTVKDMQHLASIAKSVHASACICTHKDLVKLQQQYFPNQSLLALQVGWQFITGEHEVTMRLQQCLQNKPSH
jgi:tetraacyldisaccharide 4'-kinase